jgi:hypothetical protein
MAIAIMKLDLCMALLPEGWRCLYGYPYPADYRDRVAFINARTEIRVNQYAMQVLHLAETGPLRVALHKCIPLAMIVILSAISGARR